MKDIPSPNTLADLKPGNHLCCLYETEEEHRAVLTLFLRQGLEKGEKVFCIVDGVLAAGQTLAVLPEGPYCAPVVVRPSHSRST